MKDVFSVAKRSEVMSRIRGKGNKSTELTMATIMRVNKITGWRRNQVIFGKPDFVFPTSKIALFVDGCFWHSCPKHANIPKNNRRFWTRKLKANRIRDGQVNNELKKRGWIVLRVWEHDLNKPAKVSKSIKSCLLTLSKSNAEGK